MEGASNTLSGRLFHVSTTLLLNSCLLIYNLDPRLNSLYWCPLVLASVMTVNNLFLFSTISISLTILYVWTISFLQRLYSSEGSPRLIRHSVFDFPCNAFTNLVARLCTFYNRTLSFLRLGRI